MRLAFLSDTMAATSDAVQGHGLGRANHQIATGLLNRGHEVTLFGAPGSQFGGRTVVCDGDGQKYEPQLAKAAYHMRLEFDCYIDAGHKHAFGMLFPDLPLLNVYHDKWQPYARNAVLVSEGLRTLLPPEFKNAKVVHNQIDPLPFVPSYRADTENPYAVFLGFIYKWKAPILAIEAAARARLRLLMGGSWQENTDSLWHEGENSQLLGAIPPYARNELLRGAQVYLQLGHSESFGLTTVEAGLCFSAETQIEAKGVLRGIESLYTGKMIKVSTANGSFEATENHPVWTRNGWKKTTELAIGDEILYTPYSCNKGENNEKKGVSKGTIGSIVQSLRDNDVERSSGVSGYDSRGRALAMHDSWIYEVGSDDKPFETSNLIQCGISLHSRTNRRRGNGFSKAYEKGENQAVNQYSQYIPSVDAMVERTHTGEISLLSQETRPKILAGKRLFISDRGSVISPIISSINALHGYQEDTFGTLDRMDRNPTRSSENGETNREAAIHHSTYPTAKYQTITAITERDVIRLPVYNVTTQSGTYLAEGFLVHNCGTPTVAWPTGGNLDTVRDGVNGVFIDPRNPDRVEAVCLAIQQAKMLNRRQVRTFTEQHFGHPERQAEQFEVLLERVIGGEKW